VNFQPLARRERVDSGSSFKDQLLGAFFGGSTPSKKEVSESFYKIEKLADLQPN